MNRSMSPVVEILPMLIYLVVCIACSSYLLYSFMTVVVQEMLASVQTPVLF